MEELVDIIQNFTETILHDKIKHNIYPPKSPSWNIWKLWEFPRHNPFDYYLLIKSNPSLHIPFRTTFCIAYRHCHQICSSSSSLRQTWDSNMFDISYTPSFIARFTQEELPVEDWPLDSSFTNQSQNPQLSPQQRNNLSLIASLLLHHKTLLESMLAYWTSTYSWHSGKTWGSTTTTYSIIPSIHSTTLINHELGQLEQKKLSLTTHTNTRKEIKMYSR